MGPAEQNLGQAEQNESEANASGLTSDNQQTSLTLSRETRSGVAFNTSFAK
jgi:hypothetical protein